MTNQMSSVLKNFSNSLTSLTNPGLWSKAGLCWKAFFTLSLACGPTLTLSKAEALRRDPTTSQHSVQWIYMCIKLLTASVTIRYLFSSLCPNFLCKAAAVCQYYLQPWAMTKPFASSAFKFFLLANIQITLFMHAHPTNIVHEQDTRI